MALKLRSNELKLEKEVDGLHSEISSYRRKVSSLEKERQHLQSTVEALQEEKKLLHSKLRNIPVTEKVNVVEKPSADKRDASTATEDLDTGETSSSETLISIIDTLEYAGRSSLQSNNMPDFPSFEEGSSSIPDDQLRMIGNINSLMSELAVEREELLRALRIDSSNCSKLKSTGSSSSGGDDNGVKKMFQPYEDQAAENMVRSAQGRSDGGWHGPNDPWKIGRSNGDVGCSRCSDEATEEMFYFCVLGLQF